MGLGRKTTFLEREAERKGRENEERVRKALVALRDLGEISRYRKAKIGGQLDMEGIDFQVYPEPDWSVDLQVKSSTVGKEKHLRSYGNTIACVIVDEALDDRQLLEEVRRVLGLSIAFITERSR